MSRLRGGLLVAVAVLAAGCAQKVEAGSDGGGDLTSVPTTPLSTPVTTTWAAPTDVRPTGACEYRPHIPEPAGVPVSPPATTTSRALPGDMPPNHVDNRSWRVRKALRPDVHGAAVAVLEKVGPGLRALCDAGDFAPEATRAVFADAGQPTVWITGLRAPYGQTPPAGVVFNLTMAGPQGTGCVLGALYPSREGVPPQVDIGVDGTTGEGSCVEPDSH
ncbi:hypothetical protein FHS29_003355 [Saccharothrix tamanrassetensis]|uniref:Lipoprotein n=1 Tax=Saccharothrix tamanrassetensis TaxID=1051531 RepID=A0A841CE00_9PSEU|nr:hypothetical protein [Saccharothrix tamanrassetensis]MBB5956762.1 hypothetical protein [Saccharothrix tamanrassetensis]